MKITEYKIIKNEFSGKCVLAIICDLHRSPSSEIVTELQKLSPDYILAPGDIFEPLVKKNMHKNCEGIKLLREAVKIAPTVMSLGNHEIGGTHSWNPKWRHTKGKIRECDDKYVEMIKELGVVLLDNSDVTIGNITFGGLSSALLEDSMTPDMAFIERFQSKKSPKILLCHHPEYYKKYLKDKNIDLVVSGHAHGGQWRFFGRGVFAPGQGLFPKYTSGLHDNKLIISRGLKSTGILPRFFNEPEIVKIIIN